MKTSAKYFGQAVRP